MVKKPSTNDVKLLKWNREIIKHALAQADYAYLKKLKRLEGSDRKMPDYIG